MPDDELETSLAEFYRQNPDAWRAVCLYDEALAVYQRAIAAMGPQYVVTTTNHTKIRR